MPFRKTVLHNAILLLVLVLKIKYACIAGNNFNISILKEMDFT